ncbi:9965_t:CDS:2, partial [Racocetra fulgida]
MDVLTAIKYIVRAWREVLSETVRNCFRHTGILPIIQNNEELVTNNNEELVTDDNEDELIEELHADIEALHLRNDDNSVEIRQITHNKALNAIGLLEQYLFQQDF